MPFFTIVNSESDFIGFMIFCWIASLVFAFLFMAIIRRR